jgi:DNA-binding response OmpR family regulator
MAQSAVDPAAAYRASSGRVRAEPATPATRVVNLLLIVDDELFRSSLLALATELGLDTRVEVTAADAIRSYRSNWTPHLIVLDQLMPRSELYATVRANRAAFGVPVLAITGDIGSVEPLPEPGALLLGRHAAIAEIRRLARQPRSGNAVIAIGPLSIDRACWTASFHDVPLRLNPDEVSTLVLLMEHEGAVVHRRTLVSALGGLQRDLDPRIIDVHVVRLMVALGAGSPVTVERSHDREGYRLRRVSSPGCL